MGLGFQGFRYFGWAAGLKKGCPNPNLNVKLVGFRM